MCLSSPLVTDTDPSMSMQLEATVTKASLQFTITGKIGFTEHNLKTVKIKGQHGFRPMQSIKKEFAKAGLDTSDAKAHFGDMCQALACNHVDFVIDRDAGIIPEVEAYVPGEDDTDEVVHAEVCLENTD